MSSATTVRLANRSIVVGEGRVLEEGMHEELLARGGIYADLFTLQAEAYLADGKSVRPSARYL